MLPADVACLTAPNPSPMTGDGTNTYLVVVDGSCVVIDPGPLDEGHLQRVAAQAAARGGARAIAITHGHADHMAGAARLRALTGAPVLAHSRENGVPAADRLLADGDPLPAAGSPLTALWTPGHRFDHLCFLLATADTLFAGDMLSGSGTVVIAPPEGDLRLYLSSLARLRALAPRLLLPAHGPAVADPRARLDATIAHRLRRERQILDLLQHGPLPVEAVVAVIYSETPAALLSMAARTVTAHLLKLQDEGRVRRVADTDGVTRWSL